MKDGEKTIETIRHWLLRAGQTMARGSGTDPETLPHRLFSATTSRIPVPFGYSWCGGDGCGMSDDK